MNPESVVPLTDLEALLGAQVEDDDVVLLSSADRLGEDALRAVVDAVGGAGVDHAAERLTRLHAQRRRHDECPTPRRYVPFNLNVQVEKLKRPSSVLISSFGLLIACTVRIVLPK